MSKHLPAATLAQTATLTTTPPRTRIDRSFELPTGLYVVTALCYFGFLGVMSLALMEPQLAIPMAICAIIVAAFLGTPRKWATMKPDTAQQSLSWSRFKQAGIMTHTGPMKARDAAVQVLILPVLILVWGCVIALIRALV